MSATSDTVEESPVTSEPTEKPRKAMLRGYRQKLMTIRARIKYREHAFKPSENISRMRRFQSE